MRSWLLLLAAVGQGALAAERAPTPAALRKAYETNARSLVRVIGPRESGAGVIVGADGHVVTSVAFVGLQEAQVEVDGALYRALVRSADAYQGIAVLRIVTPAAAPTPVEFRAAPVRLGVEHVRGQQLVALRLLKKGASPIVISVRKRPRDEGGIVELDQFVPRGTPIFDAKGKLVGVVVKGRRMLPIDRVKQTLQAKAE